MTRTALRLAAVALVVAVLATLGGGRYPLAVDLAVYLATGLMVWTVTASMYDWRDRKRDTRDTADR
ncbi:hypothetical protein [Streptomyces sp. NEAU-S7GS2]|uniref:hypothetical protein n=1 Tax=Streptomyces sp. NEAU-S7GS2 TaxID=2202000 RepID=UPI000D6F76D5|nr:hypothetical protein [Streptomyces sp. NEAU-S7GS2]AWN32592.1 hypothetical protein DKG71_42185 [Streptomyces sp. NEAU-S7GS2]